MGRVRQRKTESASQSAEVTPGAQLSCKSCSYKWRASMRAHTPLITEGLGAQRIVMRGIIFENVLSGGQGCLWLNMHGIKSARIMFADVSSERGAPLPPPPPPP